MLQASSVDPSKYHENNWSLTGLYFINEAYCCFQGYILLLKKYAPQPKPSSSYEKQVNF